MVGRSSDGDVESTMGCAGVGTAGAQDTAVAQLLGMPGTWQGASPEQGISSCGDIGAAMDPAVTVATDELTVCTATGCASAEADIPGTTPPTAIIRWRRNKLARSVGMRRVRIIA